MERAHLILLKRTDNGMQHATIMEQDEVLFLPVVRIHQLSAAEVIIEEGDGNKDKYAHSARWQVAASCTADHELA